MYTLTLENNPIPFAIGSNRLKFIFKWDSDYYTGNEIYTLLKFGEFEFGNDDDDETIFFPSINEVEFYLQNVTVEKFEKILLELKTKKVFVQIYRNTSVIFEGYIHADGVDGLQFTRRIKCKITDQWQELKKYDPRTNPFNYTLDNKVNIIDLMVDLLTRPELGTDHPQIAEVVNLCSVECQYYAGQLYNSSFADFAVTYRQYFSFYSNYKTVTDLVKAIFIAFGCIGFIGFNRKLYIIPRNYGYTDTYTLSRENMKAEPEADIVPGVAALHANIYTGIPGNYNPILYTDIPGLSFEQIKEKYEHVEDIYLEQPGDNTQLTAQHPGVIYIEHQEGIWFAAEIDSFRIKLSDGQYTPRTALWVLIAGITWLRIKQPRRSYLVEVLGNYDELHIGQYYVFEEIPDRFYRLRKVSYDLSTKWAKLSLIDATTELYSATSKIIFDVVMEAQNSEIEIGGTRYSGTSNALRIGNQNVFAIIDNMFASTSTTPKKYDGTTITIPSDQLNVYKTTEAYVIYLAISKSGSSPEYSYPHPDDANADWYLLTTFKDQKIFDPAYEYKVLLPKIKPGKQKYWLWMGMKSTESKIFDKIPLYSPGVIIDKVSRW